MGRYLVTGGAGFVGSHVVAALRARGDEVVIFDNFSTGHRAAIPAGVRLVEADLADAGAVDAAVAAGPWDAVFHFAALSLVGDSMRAPFHYLQANIGNGLRLIDSCTKHGVPRFILSSTAALFGTPLLAVKAITDIVDGERATGACARRKKTSQCQAHPNPKNSKNK